MTKEMMQRILGMNSTSMTMQKMMENLIISSVADNASSRIPYAVLRSTFELSRPSSRQSMYLFLMQDVMKHHAVEKAWSKVLTDQ